MLGDAGGGHLFCLHGTVYFLPFFASGLRMNAAHAAPTATNALDTKVYSNIPVVEILVNDVVVMRRKDNDYVNATQILKAAGIEKGKRTKILEREVTQGIHEKIQGGFGEFKERTIIVEKLVLTVSSR